LNPYRIEGQKTGAFEICDALGAAPDFHAIPVGNAGNITAYWKGYKEYKQKGKINTLPKMIGFQAEGAAPIVNGHVVKDPKTIATAIKIGNPASWKEAENARDESGGVIESVADEEILNAYKMLASCEGVFVEPASAAGVAGVIKKAKQGFFESRLTSHESQIIKIVCVLTGHGLKDPDRAIASIEKPKVVPAILEAVLKEIAL
jgi:threonine synthase